MVASQEEILADFVSQTGLERSLASHLLQDEQWDLIEALKSYQTALINERNLVGFTAADDDEGDEGDDLVKLVEAVVKHKEEEEEPMVRWRSSGETPPRCISRASNNALMAESVVNSNVLLMTNGQNNHLEITNGQNNRKELFVETPSYAFILPNLSALPMEFRLFLERDLIETSTLQGLENSGHLNWWTTVAQRLWPLSTHGDGNCLLHAASLGMWGFHDRRLILRNALHQILSSGSRRHALWRRWRWQQHMANQQAELELSEDEWRREWEALVTLASAQPRSTRSDEPSTAGDQTYESLEEIHVFALAHVLKRPVIVVADTVLRNANGEELAPVSFAGIYLPLECSPNECHRSPLVLCYDAAHFSALVTMQTSSQQLEAVIPITDKERRLLRLHFVADPGPDFTWWKDEADDSIARSAELTESERLELICEYLDVIQIPVRRSSSQQQQCRSVHENNAKNTIENIDRKIENIDRKTAHFIGELAEHLMRRLHLHSSRRRDRSINRRDSSSSQRINKKKARSATVSPKVTVEQMRQTNCIIAAQLNTHAHQYADDMVRNYLESARKRFETQKQNKAQPIRRDRISRSFSSSSVTVTCLNGHCEQKQLMISFGGTLTGNNGLPARPSDHLPLSNAVKSQTMPAISSQHRDSAERAILAVNSGSNQPPITTAVSSVQGAHGVTHYYVRSMDEEDQPLEMCKSPHCSNYSNGYDRLCPRCSY